jgi:hypothetical protein
LLIAVIDHRHRTRRHRPGQQTHRARGFHAFGDPIAELQKAWDDLRRWLDCIDPKTGLDAKRAMGIDPRGFDWDAMCGEWVGIA